MSNSKPERPERTVRMPRTPLNWLAIFFAFAANMLVITVAGYLVNALIPTNRYALPIVIISALLAGIATSYYAKSRGSMHAHWIHGVSMTSSGVG